MIHKLIAVQFVDARTGDVFARSDVPVEQLPASFAAATTLHLGDQDWEVVKAEPVTAEEFAARGALTLTLSRVEYVSPNDLLLTLPTICDQLPELEPAAAAALPVFRLHEDDWRQVELVSRAFAGEVDAELRSIRTIYEESSVQTSAILAFRDLHVRRLIPSPLGSGFPLANLTSSLPASSRVLGGVGPLQSEALVRGGFAFDVVGLVLYGVRTNDFVTVLGLHRIATAARDEAAETARFLAGLMSAKGLLLLDWCRCLALDPDAEVIAAYLVG